ncbi:hypothetical protein MB84_29385 (plasmid) [Pandoraea oxalativorans]|uniref:Uncharacterized protein n=1 Tax=Pandoraea oxalativorans TaxID=573737 RepID=A0A0G3IIE4_9BURK|nr:hypothetical protein MB84_29385 [Pandoraea oxalativorans]
MTADGTESTRAHADQDAGVDAPGRRRPADAPRSVTASPPFARAVDAVRQATIAPARAAARDGPPPVGRAGPADRHGAPV